MSFLGNLGRRALDAAAPPACPVDGSPVAVAGALGFTAWASFFWIDDPLCDRCGAPFEHDGGLPTLCGGCLTDEPAFDRARAAVAYDDASKPLILSFKHGDRTDLAPMFGVWLARAGAALLDDNAMIVPVPLHWRRVLARRYNQAALLAHALGRTSDRPVAPGALVRTRPTRPQKDLSRDGRRRNLAGAISPSANAGELLGGRTVIIVDDVYTTGATLSACARAARAAGASSVAALTLARVVKSGPVSI